MAQLSAVINGAAMGYGNFVDLWFVNDSDRQALAGSPVPVTFFDSNGNGYTITMASMVQQIGPYGGNYQYGLSYSSPTLSPAGTGTPLTTGGGGGGGGGGGSVPITGFYYSSGNFFDLWFTSDSDRTSYMNAVAAGGTVTVTIPALSLTFTITWAAGTTLQTWTSPPQYGAYGNAVTSTYMGPNGGQSQSGTVSFAGAGGGGGGSSTPVPSTKITPWSVYQSSQYNLDITFQTAAEAAACVAIFNGLNGYTDSIMVRDGTYQYNTTSLQSITQTGAQAVSISTSMGWSSSYSPGTADIRLTYYQNGYQGNSMTGINSMNFPPSGTSFNFAFVYGSMSNAFATTFSTSGGSYGIPWPSEMYMMQGYGSTYYSLGIIEVSNSVGTITAKAATSWQNMGGGSPPFNQMIVVLGYNGSSGGGGGGGGGSTPTYTNSRIDTDGTIFKDVAMASISGSDKIVAVGTGGKIRYTGDSGNTWSTATLSPSTSSDFKAVTTTYNSSNNSEGFNAITIDGYVYASNDAVNWSQVTGLTDLKGTSTANGITSMSVAGRSYSSYYVISYGMNRKAVYYNGPTGGFTSSATIASTGSSGSLKAIDSTYNNYGTKTVAVGDSGTFAWTTSTNPSSPSDWNVNTFVLDPGINYDDVKMSLRSSSQDQPSVYAKTEGSSSSIAYVEDLNATSYLGTLTGDTEMVLSKEYSDGNYANSVYQGGKYGITRKYDYTNPSTETTFINHSTNIAYAGYFEGESYPVIWSRTQNGSYFRANSYGIIHEAGYSSSASDVVVGDYNILAAFKIPYALQSTGRYHVITDQGMYKSIGADGPYSIVEETRFQTALYSMMPYMTSDGFGVQSNRYDGRKSVQIYANTISSGAYSINGFMNYETNVTRTTSTNMILVNSAAPSEVMFRGSAPVTKIVKSSANVSSGQTNYAYITPAYNNSFYQDVNGSSTLGFYNKKLFERPKHHYTSTDWRIRDVAATSNANVFFAISSTSTASMNKYFLGNPGNPIVTTSAVSLYGTNSYMRSLYYDTGTDKLIMMGAAYNNQSNVLISTGNSAYPVAMSSNLIVWANSTIQSFSANGFTKLNGNYFAFGQGNLHYSANGNNWITIHKTDNQFSSLLNGETGVGYQNGYYYMARPGSYTTQNTYISIGQSIMGFKPMNITANGDPITMANFVTYSFRPKITWSPSHNSWVMIVKNSIYTSNNTVNWNRKNFKFQNPADTSFYYNTKLITTNNALLFVTSTPGRYFTTYRSNT